MKVFMTAILLDAFFFLRRQVSIALRRHRILSQLEILASALLDSIQAHYAFAGK